MARDAAGLPDLRLHDLRRSAASFMVDSGVDLFAVGKVLGHASYQSTQRYSHLANDTLLAAMQAGAAKRTFPQIDCPPNRRSSRQPGGSLYFWRSTKAPRRQGDAPLCVFPRSPDVRAAEHVQRPGRNRHSGPLLIDYASRHRAASLDRIAGVRARLLRIADTLRESYWFLPAIMTVAALLLALAMVFVDSHFGTAWMDRVPWLYAARPDGARSLLSSVGGSMIGVAGTTFSVTIAAVVYASGQYGPRLLSNFMADRGNQVTLGTFIATFLYSLVVLRTIRSPGESGAGAAAFVPQLALAVAMLLVLASIAVLIFFIHHVPQRIHINSVIEEVGERLLKEIDNRFPAFVGRPLENEDDDEEVRIPDALRDREDVDLARQRVAIRAKDTGYVQVVDDETLIDTARQHDLVVRLRHQPGDFAHRGSILAEAWPAERCDEVGVRELRGAYAMGSRRTPLQDLRFLIDELVEIAARALSPGVNDPFTAKSCLDWLAAAFADLVQRDLPSRLRADEDGTLRVIACPQTFALLLDRGFGALAQYASTDMIAGKHFLHALGDVALRCRSPARIALLRQQVQDFRTLAEEQLSGVNARTVCARADELLRALDEPAYRRQLRDSADWLGGTA